MGSSKKGILNVLAAAILWGSSGVCAQYIIEQGQVPSPFLTMTRLLLAGPILLVIAIVHGDKVFAVLKNRQDTIRLLIFSLFGAMTVQLTFMLAIEHSNAATATILQFFSPSIIVTWFALVRKKRPGGVLILAIITSLIGMFLLVTHGDPTSLSVSHSALFWGIASAFAAAFYVTYPSRLISRYGTVPIVGWSMLLGGLMMVPFYAGKIPDFVVNIRLSLAFFYLVLFGTALTFSLYLKGAQIIGGSKASILSCAEPLSSALLSLLLLGVVFTFHDWLGTLLILSSVVLISIDSRRSLSA
ncbi:EamA family transporter [Serratia sp. S1B]|nr:EamA family transporter [Serratia sp. S1B]